uniref:Uncharacterized protein n=1 Tax=Rhizophora mucronata TaxID=61149 RepID=A0A2P2NE57_RHIMU
MIFGTFYTGRKEISSIACLCPVSILFYDVILFL